MCNAQLIDIANQNRVALINRIAKGEFSVNEKTLKALEQPVTMLMRPLKDDKVDNEGKKLVRVHIYGQGFTEVAACREVLPERKSRI